MEGIGIALDVPGDRMFVTDFAGSIYSRASTDRRAQLLYAQGNLTASPTPKSDKCIGEMT